MASSTEYYSSAIDSEMNVIAFGVTEGDIVGSNLGSSDWLIKYEPSGLLFAEAKLVYGS